MRPNTIANTLEGTCFNPRICKRCDVNVRYDALNMPVSIHASVKDATLGYARLLLTVNVSIHASVKDATLMKVLSRINPNVSIHASVKDATMSIEFNAGLQEFQSTHL